MYQERNQQIIDAFLQAFQGELVFNSLIERIAALHDADFLKNLFLDQLPNLLKFVDKKHKEMLYLKGAIEEYRKIKRGFRNILLYFAQESENLHGLKEKYLGARQGQSAALKSSLAGFFNSAEENKLAELEDKLIHFRRDYLCRFSMSKVKNVIEKEMSKMTEGKQLTEVKSNILPLLKITYLHSANANILNALDRSGMEIMPKAKLNDAKTSGAIDPKVVPFLMTDCKDQYLIPGASLDNGKQIYEDAKKDMNPFRFVFASNSVHSKSLDLINPLERCAQKSCLLGKDIQIIFVDEKNRGHLEVFFIDRGLAEHIQIEDLESLATVSTYNQFAKSFFSDIASSKKLSLLK